MQPQLCVFSMKIVLVAFAAATLVCGQDTNVSDAINTIFTDYWSNFDVVTSAPLKSYGALSKCGEGDQADRFVCVPYHKCDSATNTVREDVKIDFADLIDIRAGEDDRKCAHYLDVCCRRANGTVGANVPSTTVTPRPTVTAGTRPTPPATTSGGNNGSFCGIRNTNGVDFKITGNSDNEAEFGEFPWMVAVLKKNYDPAVDDRLSICGGSLIAPKVVLTGAHCVQGRRPGDIKVRAGEWDTQTESERIPFQERNVATIIVHESYLPRLLNNNVALLILDSPLAKVETVGTVCLPTNNQRVTSTECLVTGWGKNVFGQEGRYSAILKKIRLPLVQRDDCERQLKATRLGPTFTLHRSFICAGGEAGVDACTGDGGSPLVCPAPNDPSRYIQVGIVAWGIGCGEFQVPGVYADVAQFRNWIDTKLDQQGINTDSYA